MWNWIKPFKIYANKVRGPILPSFPLLVNNKPSGLGGNNKKCFMNELHTHLLCFHDVFVHQHIKCFISLSFFFIGRSPKHRRTLIVSFYHGRLHWATLNYLKHLSNLFKLISSIFFIVEHFNLNINSFLTKPRQKSWCAGPRPPIAARFYSSYVPKNLWFALMMRLA